MLPVKGFRDARETLAARASFCDSQKRLARRLVVAQLVLQTTNACEGVCDFRCVVGCFGRNDFRSLRHAINDYHNGIVTFGADR